jgi:UDP-N-acetylmuramate dehydrogenase
MADQELITFLEEKKVQYRQRTSIKPYVTIGIGGTARLIIVANNESHLLEILRQLHLYRYRYVFLGGGSNVLFTDDCSAMVVVINRTKEIEKVEDQLLKLNSGVTIGDLMQWTIRHEAGGMEFLAGIPGTVGGAAAVNAGAFGQSISAILEKAEILTTANEIKIVEPGYFDFSYRNSRFKYGEEVIVNVFLRFNAAPGQEIRKKVEANTRYRKENHPCSSFRSAGCFFKNPVIDGRKTSAGQLLHKSGFKGTSYKTLEISASHANFIINSGEATFRDICELEAEIVGKISRESGITLEREVIYVSPEGKKY